MPKTILIRLGEIKLLKKKKLKLKLQSNKQYTLDKICLVHYIPVYILLVECLKIYNLYVLPLIRNR